MLSSSAFALFVVGTIHKFKTLKMAGVAILATVLASKVGKRNLRRLILMILLFLVSACWKAKSCFSQNWSSPMRVSPESTEAYGPQLVVDREGRVWCGWSGHPGVYASYYENSTWLTPEEAIPVSIYTAGWGGITVDTARVWVVTSDDVRCFVAYRENNEWSNVDTVPYHGFSPHCIADSSGNFWVAFINGWEVFSCYYNDAEGWSDTMRVSPTNDSSLIGFSVQDMTIDTDGKPWCLFQGSGDTDYVYVTFYDGEKWNPPIFTVQMPWEDKLRGVGIHANYDGSIWVVWKENMRLHISKYMDSQWSDIKEIDDVSSGSDLTSDLQNKVWCFWVHYPSPYPLLYSIWNGNEWSPAKVVDSLGGVSYTAVYDSHRDRIWLAWESTREGYPAAYTMYTKATSIEENENTGVLKLRLFENTPNPFWENTQIQYQISKSAQISLEIYSISGQLVKTLVNKKEMMSGIHKTYWNGQDNAGNEVPSGIYFCTVETKDFSQTKKLVFLNY